MSTHPNVPVRTSLESNGLSRDALSRNDRQSIEAFARFLGHTDALAAGGKDPASLRAWLDLAEAWRITEALRDCKGNRSAAARLLGIGRRTLYAKMDKLGIEPSWQI